MVRPIVLALVLLLAACATNKPYTVELMPAPAMYSDGAVDPFMGNEAVAENLPRYILYATVRQPSPPDAKELEKFYGGERSYVMRLGQSRIRSSDPDITWEEAKQITLLKNRTTDFPIQVVSVEEFGILDQSINMFSAPELVDDVTPEAGERFAAEINERLEASPIKDVFIYVHGFRTNFQSPQLVAAELWHFLGYQGVFTTFQWPATMGRLDYAGNAETAMWAAPFLRSYIQYLASETNAERIHVIGYSAGTRVVTSAMEQFTLLLREKTDEEIREETRLGHVILAGSDVDSGLAATYIAQGMLRIPEHFTIYVSQLDGALGLARWLYKQERLGELLLTGDMHPTLKAWLFEDDRIRFIDVTDAEVATGETGHRYLRGNPWVSSDILSTLMYDLTPEDRGLVRTEEYPAWQFPDDYLDRLVEYVLSNYSANAGNPTAP